MNTKAIGQRLVEYCRKGQHMEAIDELYSENIVSVEAGASEHMPSELRGIEAVREKNRGWIEHHDVHSNRAEGPFPHQDRFAVRFIYVTSPKSGPNAGKQSTLDEVAVYTVEGGKIVREEFYYDSE